MSGGVFSTTLDRLLRWSRANSLWYTSVGQGCCANELLETVGCRYDLERFGCQPQVDPSQCDLLILSGAISHKSVLPIKALYDQMPDPKYVLALGACACSGGVFASHDGYAVVAGGEKVIPVDVFVPGCPPRPEAIMNGLITLQEKIRGGN